MLTATRDVDIIPPNGDERMRIGSPSSSAKEVTSMSNTAITHKVFPSKPRYAPRGWQACTIDVPVGKIVAHCMEPNDGVLSKLGAGREKDLEFASADAALGLIERSVVLSRLSLVPATAYH